MQENSPLREYVARNISVGGGPFWLKASVRYGGCTFNTEGGTITIVEMIDHLVAQIERHNRRKEGSTVKTADRLGWVPVNDRSADFAADPPHYDAASHSSLIHVACACGKGHWFDKRDGELWVCEECGRVYRTQARFWVEEHMGGGR